MDAALATPSLSTKPVVLVTQASTPKHSRMWIFNAVSVLLLLASTTLGVVSMSLSDWRKSARVLPILSLVATFVLLAWTLAVIATSRLNDQSTLKRQLHWLGRTILPVVGALGTFLGVIAIVLWGSSDDTIGTSYDLLVGSTILLPLATTLVRYNVPMREAPLVREIISPRSTEPLV